MYERGDHDQEVSNKGQGKIDGLLKGVEVSYHIILSHKIISFAVAIWFFSLGDRCRIKLICQEIGNKQTLYLERVGWLGFWH